MVKKQDAGQTSDPYIADTEVVLNASIQNHLGSMLKRHYDDIVNAPIPDQFLVLLAELEAKERSNDG